MNKNHKVHSHELSSVAKGAGINIVGKVAGSGLQYVYAIIAARILKAEIFGILMLGITILSIVGAISRLGLENGVIKFVAQYHGIHDKARVKGIIILALKYSFIASISIGALLFFTASHMSTVIFQKPELEWVLKALSLSLPFYSLMIISLSSIQGFKIMKYSVYSQNIFQHIFNIALVFIFVFFIGKNLHVVVTAYALSLLFTAILSMYFLVKTFPDIMSIKSIKESKMLFRFSLPLLLVFIVNLLIMWTDTLMLGYFTSSKEVGIYNLAMRTAMFIYMFLISFNSIFAPIISDLYHKKEFEKLESLFKTITKWIYMISLPFFLILALLSKEVMLIFGQEFVAGWIPLIILAFTNLVNSGTGCTGYMLAMSGKQDIMMYNSLGICVLNIFLNYLLIPSHGIIGASIASGISITIYALVMLIEVYIYLKIHPYDKTFLIITLIGLLVFGIFYLLEQHTVLDLSAIQRILFSVPLLLCSFAWLIYKWGSNENDRFLIEVFKRKFSKNTK